MTNHRRAAGRASGEPIGSGQVRRAVGRKQALRADDEGSRGVPLPLTKSPGLSTPAEPATRGVIELHGRVGR